MKTVWKYILRPGTNRVEMPEGAKLLDVQIQDGRPVLWALVKPLNPRVYRDLMIVGTGSEHEELESYDVEYVGTFQLPHANLVFHLFDFGQIGPVGA